MSETPESIYARHLADANGVEYDDAIAAGESNRDIINELSGMREDSVKEESPIQVSKSQQSGTHERDPATAAVFGALAGAPFSGIGIANSFKNGVSNVFKNSKIPQTSEPPRFSFDSTNPIYEGHELHPGSIANAEFNAHQRLANELRTNPTLNSSVDSLLRDRSAMAPVNAEQMRREIQEAKPFLTKVAENPAVRKAGNIATNTGKAVMPVVNKFAPVLGLASAAAQEADMENRWTRGDLRNRIQAVISGLGAAGSAGAAIPFQPPMFRAIETGIGVGAPLLNTGLDRALGKDEKKPVHKADGGPVLSYPMGGGLNYTMPGFAGGGSSDDAKKFQLSTGAIEDLLGGYITPSQFPAAAKHDLTYFPKTDKKSLNDMAKELAMNTGPMGVGSIANVTSRVPLYSTLQRTIAGHKMDSMPGAQWSAWLKANAPKSSKKEADAVGLHDWLATQPSVKKYDIHSHVDQNTPSVIPKTFGQDKTEFGDISIPGPDTSQFKKYTLPGGENYKETTLSIPESGTDFIVPEAHAYGDTIADTNRVAHIRTNERPTADNKRALFLEELQSDWAQQGRDRGFGEGVQIKYDPNVESYRAYDINGNTISLQAPGGPYTAMNSEEAVRAALPNSKYSKGIVEGPYVTDTKDWTALGLKHALKRAVDENHDYLAWTTGAQQAKRYKLSNQLQDLAWERDADGTYTISGETLDGVPYQENIPANKLHETIGKDFGDKIASSESDNGYFKNVDLQVGGEGMKGYYDNIVPSTMNDVLKQIGSSERVKPVNIQIDHGHVQDEHGIPSMRPYSETSQQMGIELTPELKDLLRTDGLPTFKRGGKVPIGMMKHELHHSKTAY